MTERRGPRTWLPLAAAAVALLTAACGNDGQEASAGGRGGSVSGTITIDGSSTVAPLSEAAAELFQAEHPGVRVVVATSGTGGGFERFCRGETDISDASRPIKPEEAQACEAAGIRYEQVQVALDGLSVVVNPANGWAGCLTVEQLNKIWDRGSTVSSWRQVDPTFPDEPLELFGAGTDSGTFDYFTEAINGEEGRSRSDYAATEDDNVTVQGVSGTRGGLGYFGLSYLLANQGKVKAVAIDGGDGCVEPSVETVQSGAYQPLSRRLLVYPSAKALERPEVRAFVEFYVENAERIAEQAQFVPMTTDQAKASRELVDRLARGGQ